MADAEDLKSSGDFSSCGFDSHPGHHFFFSVYSQLTASHFPRNRRVTFPALVCWIGGPTAFAVASKWRSVAVE